MLEQNFQSVYEKFKLQFFRRLFSQVREREGSLSAMEAFSVEVIHELDAPTIGQFADFLGISQSNATYKVNQLTAKGYLEKHVQARDRREVVLTTSEKFTGYFDEDKEDALQQKIRTAAAQFTPAELDSAERVLLALALEPMPNMLILDEPLSGVDVEGMSLLMDMLDEIRKKFDLSILMTTHDFTMLEQYCDQVVLLQGKILRRGTPLDVLSSDEFAKAFHMGGGAQA